MKFTSKQGPLLAKTKQAFGKAVDDTVEEARRIAPDRTGKYKRSLTHRPIEEKGNRLESGVYSPLSSASIKERGGTIRARRGEYLAIPMPDGSMRKVKQVVIPARPTVKKAGKKFTSFMTRRLREASSRR